MKEKHKNKNCHSGTEKEREEEKAKNSGREHMYVVLGATGNTGSVAAKTLLERGEKVRVVGRDAGRLAQLTQLGAESVAARFRSRDYPNAWAKRNAGSGRPGRADIG